MKKYIPYNELKTLPFSPPPPPPPRAPHIYNDQSQKNSVGIITDWIT